MSRARIYVRCNGKQIIPADDYAAEQMERLHEEHPHGEYFAKLSRITAAGRDERLGLFGLWWAGCELFAESTEDIAFDTQRKVSDEVLKSLGFVRPRFVRVSADKIVFDMIPVSIAESNMTDEEFILLMERARSFMMTRFDRDPWQEWQNEQDAKKANEQAAKRRRA